MMLLHPPKVPLWRRLAAKLPFITKKCPFGNSHWRWARLCNCAYGRPMEEPEWHGGLYDFVTEAELHPCATCYPDLSDINGHVALTFEEKVLVASWREFREQTLDDLDKDAPWRYTVNVRWNNEEDIYLMSRVNGAGFLHLAKSFYGPQDIPAGTKPN